MAVIITDLCINCDACVDECPAMAITSSSDNSREYTYVKPEACIECVDSSLPKCSYVCPTEGAIAWDLPYTAEYLEHFKDGHESGAYTIKVHKIKGLMLPDNSPRPYRENIPMDYRSSRKGVDVDELNNMMLKTIGEGL